MDNRIEGIAHVLLCIADTCQDEGDRIYLGSTNDEHTLRRQGEALLKIVERMRKPKP